MTNKRGDHTYHDTKRDKGDGQRDQKAKKLLLHKENITIRQIAYLLHMQEGRKRLVSSK